MSNLSELIPAGGGQNNTDFVADGAITSGKPVILNSAGTVSPISATGSPQELGTPVTFTPGTGGSEYNSVAYDTANNKIIIAYRDNGNSNYGTAIVGTVSGTSISFGTAVVFESAATAECSASYDVSTGTVVIAYQDAANSQLGTAIVGTVSGTSISFGSPSIFGSGATLYISSAYDSVNSKVVIAYQDYGVSTYGRAVVATVSGTSVSFGSSVTFESAATEYTSCAYNSTDEKIVISYKDSGNSSRGTSIVGTVSGTSISFGTAVVFNSGNCSHISSAYDSVNNKIVIAFFHWGWGGRAIVGTVSGTSISFGSPVDINGAAGFEYSSTVYDPNSGNVVVSYKDVTNSNYATLTVGTVSGTSVSFATPVVIQAVTSGYFSSAYDATATKIVIAYRDNTNPFYGKSVVFSPISSNLTATNLLGIASAAILDTATGTINTWGSRNEVQTSLTIGSDYYVQSDGTITTTSTSPAQLIGTAITATQINIKDYTG